MKRFTWRLLPILSLVAALLPGLKARPQKSVADPSPALAAEETFSERQTMALLNDPALPRNWGLLAARAQRAWSISRGSRAVVVAVIDTGVDTAHPDLRENIWINRGESGRDESGRDRARNGRDDDGNGFVDDVHGWNFAAGSNDLRDRHGHGTHIAGIIGATGGNGIGISGIAPRVSLMVLKYWDPARSGGDSLTPAVAAIRYAVRMGADIINFSAGGRRPDPAEREAIQEAAAAGVLFVAAAGNESANSDELPYFPADYDLANIVSVTAVDRSDRVLSSSNYGERSVDIAAPGREIYSTLPGGRYGVLSGTSQATAFVTGVAALMLAQERGKARPRPEELIDRIVRSGDAEAGLRGKTRARTRLNSFRALALRSGSGPGAQRIELDRSLGPLVDLATK